MQLQGGCYCGRIRYEADGEPFDRCCCHCTMCRRTTGAPFVAWFTVRRAEFRFTKGEPARFASSARGLRSFCPTCGTQLTFQYADDSDEIDVTTASLDDPEAVAPLDHIYSDTMLSWIKLDDGLPRRADGYRRD